LRRPTVTGMEKHNLEVNILGSSFKIQSRDDHGYLKQLVSYLERAVKQIQERYSSYDPVKISLLAALNITDELFRCRSVRDGVDDTSSQEVERIAERLIDTIDRSLTEN
jgi:cell division protein ZapA (FtsZ GTPase activity inhibitor)